MIEIKNIVKTAGEKVILDDISLTIESGSFVVLIGPSGCGKTTTLKLLNKIRVQQYKQKRKTYIGIKLRKTECIF